MAQPQPQREKDSVRVDPKHYSVDIDNDQVRVLRAKYGPREKSVMHAHPSTVVVFLNDSRFRMTFADGRTEDRDMKAGQTYFSGPEEHLPENLTNGTLDVIIIELKR
jgi:mannose-6-phosphate isomerase-like protein (cupin superfamily)